ncbi:MAG: PQQ-binding-like beta-propeller repeat protein [Planctomycetota bacterium]|nr:PQQ-binding-like beta-propeller repeat protein [Planctomycetota bacterium]
MRGFLSARRGLLLVIVATFAVGMFGISDAAGDGHVLKKPRGDAAGSLADLGVRQLERLPWEAYIVRFNLATSRPVSVAACYLMDRHLLVISAAGRVYCLDRRNLEPRWVSTLRYRLAQPPTASGRDYVFLTKDAGGACWLETFSIRSGAQGDRFPRKLRFSASSGISANGSSAFIPSLGSPRSNKTVEAVSLISGRGTWGYHGTGLIFGGTQLDPDGQTLVFASDDGKVTALRASATAPNEENWVTALSGAVDSAPVVTPEHVIVGTHDGLLYNLNLLSGEVNWMKGLDAPIKKRGPWVLGSTKKVKRSTGVEGAAEIEVDQFVGAIFTRTRKGLHAHDLVTGGELFADPNGGRPLCMKGKWLLTRGRDGQVTLRNSAEGYAAQAKLNLRMFALIPTNRTDGAIYACTSDGSVVAALPK